MKVKRNVTDAGEPLLLSVHEAAHLLGLGLTTVRSLIKTGELPSVVVGHRRLVSRAALAEFVQNLEAQQKAS